jgi:hypothetical protein
VVTAQINGVLPNALCSYNITLDTFGEAAAGAAWNGSWDLSGLRLLNDEPPDPDAPQDVVGHYTGGLGFVVGQLPAFVTPRDSLRNLRIVYGSGYKLHGDGPSAFPAIDDIISDGRPKELTADDARPHLLMLTGGQIVADDVATCLLPTLTSLGQRLVAGSADAATHESVPVPGADGGRVPVTREALPEGRRHKLMRDTAKVTSDSAHNHLIGFGEYAAMYLLA